MRVLIVGPDGSLRKSLKASLLTAGATKIWEAANAKDAMTFAAKHEKEINLIVADHVRPELDAFDLAAKLRQGDHPVDCPVLALTSRAKFSIRRRVGEPDAVLRKPFRPSSLSEAIAKAKGRYAAHRNRIAVLATDERFRTLRSSLNRDKGKFWGELTNFDCAGACMEAFNSKLACIGMVVVDKKWVETLDRKSRSRLRVYLRNSDLPVAVVGRDDQADSTASLVRAFAMPGPETDTGSGKSAFRSAEARVQWGWRLARLVKEAKSALQARKYAVAAQAFRKALALDGFNAVTLTMLGDTLRADGRRTEARKMYRKAQSLDPKIPHLEQKLEAVR